MRSREYSTGGAKPRGWLSALRVVAGAALALALAGPAAASTVFGFTRDMTGATRVSEYDLSTGNLVLGASHLLDQNITGNSGPVPFGGFGGGAFDPSGGFWGAIAGQGGEAIVGQFDLSTGNLVLGGAVRLDQNTSGDTGPVPLSGFGGFTFDADGDLWAALAGQAGETLIGQFDRTSGNLVLGTAIRLDQNLAGDTGPIPLGGFGGFTFGPDGKLWAAVAGQAGETILGQFDLSTGNLLLGGAIRLDQNTSGDTGPVPLSGFGGFTFDPDGNLWAALEGQAGDTLLGQFDLATGNLVLGTARRLDYNITGDGAPVPFEEFAGFAFAPELAAPGGVPEPATWAMMILGFGATGAMVRRRRAALA